MSIVCFNVKIVVWPTELGELNEDTTAERGKGWLKGLSHGLFAVSYL